MLLGAVLPVSFLLVSGLAVAQTTATAKGLTADAATAEDYDSLQEDIKQSQVRDALRRIQMLEQSNRFLSKRIELLERKVDDIRNDRY